ncbi:hypothetical protein OAD26_00410 [bacterium]|nr:hypothetical protein [bacterium]
MLYVFLGNDTNKVRKEAHLFVQKEGGGSSETITTEVFEDGILTDLAGGSSLFGSTETIVIDTPSEKEDVFDAVVKNSELLAESPNLFVVIEKKLLAPEKKKLAKYAKELFEYSTEGKTRFNTFGLSDALLRKDKKSLWILLQKAQEESVSAEEVLGTLYWQIKMLLLVGKTTSPLEAGQKQFTYQKAQRALPNFKDGEVQILARNILELYHDAHLGKRDAYLGLERLVLSL